jgi:nitrogen fixation/metabolism regulation signal transduction histidine kinase
MRKRTVFSIGIVSLVASLLMLQLTTPQMVGPLGVLAFFVLVYIFFACVMYLVLGAVIVTLKRTARKGKWTARLESISGMKLYYYSSFIALAPVIMLGMRSVGLLRPVDILLVVAFELLGCFYISRRF